MDAQPKSHHQPAHARSGQAQNVTPAELYALRHGPIQDHADTAAQARARRNVMTRQVIRPVSAATATA
ncbi:MAG: hypothetical protein QOD83_258 [Solirubrobacteraceae bacterium]|jgi:hypothetical protein|nr:hypothetical protein [Solirubrobacteraceae bacterium]